jgi:hypothetical protein
LSEEDIYLLAILLSQVATITLDILPALESRVVQKVHARVFNYNSVWVVKAESARRYTTYKCFNFAEALGYLFTTRAIDTRPDNASPLILDRFL